MTTESFYTESGSSPPTFHEILGLRFINGLYDDVLTDEEIVERQAMKGEIYGNSEWIDIHAFRASIKAQRGL